MSLAFEYTYSKLLDIFSWCSVTCWRQFGWEFEAEVWSRYQSWGLVKILKQIFGPDFEAELRLSQDFEAAYFGETSKTVSTVSAVFSAVLPPSLIVIFSSNPLLLFYWSLGTANWIWKLALVYDLCHLEKQSLQHSFSRISFASQKVFLKAFFVSVKGGRQCVIVNKVQSERAETARSVTLVAAFTTNSFYY